LLPPVRAVPKRWFMRKRAVRASTAVGNRGVVVVRSWRRDGPDSGVPPGPVDAHAGGGPPVR
ncbi:MAG TPA: hypothetical protein VIC35_11195, partial [Acidimicrobiia bacterium]